jgi:hypothetical protein
MIPGVDFPLWYIPVGIWLLGWFSLFVGGHILIRPMNFGDFVFAGLWPILVPIFILLEWQSTTKRRDK